MRRVLFACALLIFVGAGAFLWFHFWGGSTFDAFPPGALDNYLPHDSAAVVALDLKQLRDNGELNTPLGKVLCAALAKEQLGLPLALLGVDPATDVDEMRLAFSKGDTSRPLALIRGRFDRQHFKVGPGQLEELKQDRFRLYRHHDGDRDLTLALAGDTLLVCLDRQRTLTALRAAAGKAEPTVADEKLANLLNKVERKRAIWFAANLRRLGRPSELLFAAQLQPIFEQADTLYGSIAWTTELRTAVEFAGHTEASATRLETHLKEVATSVGLFSPFAREEYERVFLRLFADAEITRRGAEVTLRSRLRLE